MKQLFPFGRGSYGSRQRLCLEFTRWGGAMVVHDAGIKVLQTHAPDVNVFTVGTSKFQGRRVFFMSTNFRGVFSAARQAFKNRKVVRRANNTKQTHRRNS